MLTSLKIQLERRADENKNVRGALATLLLNLSVAFIKKPGMQESKDTTALVLAELFGDGKQECDETMFRICVGFGTLLATGSCTKDHIVQTEVPGKLLGLDMASRSAKLRDVITELKRIVWSS